ncbi:MAG: pentapeptide repeat-containing protein [Actinobacteria bacterium]|nr:pentapeptide repeat-containing protein [Actinomycetota bacterium]
MRGHAASSACKSGFLSRASRNCPPHWSRSSATTAGSGGLSSERSLRGATLNGLNLRGRVMDGANMAGASLIGSRLDGLRCVEPA